MSLRDGIEILREEIAQMPQSPGVYKMISAQQEVLYVGKAKNLPKRVSNYTHAERLPYRLQSMVSQIARVEHLTAKNEAEALLLEASLIKEIQPKYNIQLRDGKSFPYILLTEDKEFNMLKKYRGTRKKDGQYFGPFPSAGAVNSTLNTLQKIFPLRSCSDAVLNNRDRPCIEYQIKRCAAPCVGKVEKEAYDQIVQDAKDFLGGKTSEMQKRLSEQMDKYSNNQQYEKAAEIRDRIYALTKVQADNRLSFEELGDADLVAIYRKGKNVCVVVRFVRLGQSFGNRMYFPSNSADATDEEVLMAFLGQLYQTNEPADKILLNRQLEEAEILQDALFDRFGRKVEVHSPQRGEKFKLIKHCEEEAEKALSEKIAENLSQKKFFEMVAEEFEFSESPEKIEVYDNSHIQGSSPVGAMIVVTEDGFAKNLYRKFNIKDSNAGDDYDMMREVLRRRIKNAEKDALPDIMLIDGGKGQLSVANEILQELDVAEVTLIAISKGEDRNAGREDYHMVDKPMRTLEHGSELAHFMQRIRDEAHRFAITSHRAQRSKKLKTSQLDSIEGIGATRKKALLSHFGSVSAIKQAEIEDLQMAEGISKKIAELVYNHFH